MAINYTTRSGLLLPDNAEKPWGQVFRDSMGILDHLLWPDGVFGVAPNFTDANLGSDATDRRAYDTIQAAIDAASAGDSIYVWPGNYAETIEFTKTLTLHGMSGPHVDPVLGNTILRGANTAAPIISVAPPDNTVVRVILENFYLWNQYSTTNATEIIEAYLAEIVEPTTYGSTRNLLMFRNCLIRMMTYGEDNKWAYGFNVDGWHNLTLEGCQVASYGFAGGNNNGGVRDLFYLRGTHPSTDPARIELHDVRVSQEWLGSGPMAHFDIDNAVEGFVDDCKFSYDYINISDVGSNGTNDVTGLTNSSDFIALNNVAGFDATLI